MKPLAIAPLNDIIKSSIGIPTEGYKHQAFFYYPKRGGIHSLIKSLEKNISHKIRTNFEVKEIRKKADKWVVVGNEERVFDKIISTIHLSDLIRLLENVPNNVKEAVKGLNHNSLITVMLGIDEKRLNDLSWLYIPDRDISTHRVSFPSNFSKYVSPNNKSSILAEITCSQNDDIWKSNENEIIDKVVSDLHRLKIIDKRTVCFSMVKKTKYAYVIYDLDYSNNIDLIKRYLKDIGIELCGRFSEFEYLNMDACIRSAMEKVRYLDGLSKIPSLTLS